MDHASRLAVAYIGNFKPEHSTENHVRQALERLGHEVIPLQEDDGDTWLQLALAGRRGGLFPNLVLWTRTWSLPQFHQDQVLEHLAELGIPTVGFHLDRWWGLDREDQVVTEPFFRCSTVITADGGHTNEWAAAGVRHHWMPPAVLGSEAELGTFTPAMASAIGFVGSWSVYHEQWQHRRDLVGWLGRSYGRNFGLWPKGGRQVRGQDLRDLYASLDVIVGDSCMVPPSSHYWSDRIPETLGRGGLLIHPYTEGLAEAFEGTLTTWELGDWNGLRSTIDGLLEAGPERRKLRAEAGREVVLRRHTYEVRMGAVIELLADGGEL